MYSVSRYGRLAHVHQCIRFTWTAAGCGQSDTASAATSVTDLAAADGTHSIWAQSLHTPGSRASNRDSMIVWATSCQLITRYCRCPSTIEHWITSHSYGPRHGEETADIDEKVTNSPAERSHCVQLSVANRSIDCTGNIWQLKRSLWQLGRLAFKPMLTIPSDKPMQNRLPKNEKAIHLAPITLTTIALVHYHAPTTFRLHCTN